MTLFKHEMRRGRTSLIIWTSSIAFFIIICVFMFPEMRDQMEEVNDMFSSMGGFTAAFGMDRLNFGEFIGFYAVECGNILGLGGAFFAALLGISALAKEEKDHTADFLLTHPISRTKVISSKLCAIVFQIVLMNVVVFICTLLSVKAIGENPQWDKVVLLHLAYFILQLEIAVICFAVSAFISRGGLGLGLGIAAVLYFLNIIANITDSAKFLKYITPFGFAEGADIIDSGTLDATLVTIGIVICVVCGFIAFYKYSKKDIR